MEIKPNTVAVVQITSEPVFVLQVQDGGPYLSGQVAVVRRANMTEAKGLMYVLDSFAVEELESAELAKKRAQAEFMSMKAGMGEAEFPAVTLKN